MAINDALSGLIAEIATNEKQADDDSLGELGQLVQELERLKSEAEDLESALSSKKQEIREFAVQKIPDLMLSLGISSLNLTSGKKVYLKDIYSGKIKPETEGEAIEWLVNHGHGEIIKTAVEARFSPKQLDSAIELANKLSSEGYQVSARQAVHSSTMAKWVREMSEAGEEIPEKLFETNYLRIADIK